MFMLRLQNRSLSGLVLIAWLVPDGTMGRSKPFVVTGIEVLGKVKGRGNS
jgi:hypothetical protein